jgi:hypothetical protein
VDSVKKRWGTSMVSPRSNPASGRTDQSNASLYGAHWMIVRYPTAGRHWLIRQWHRIPAQTDERPPSGMRLPGAERGDGSVKGLTATFQGVTSRRSRQGHRLTTGATVSPRTPPDRCSETASR